MPCITNKSCIMGCPKEFGYRTLHNFPKDRIRRAEWCRILGVYPRAKNVVICGAHFSECHIFGRKLSKFAIPNPSEPRQVYTSRFEKFSIPHSTQNLHTEKNIIEDAVEIYPNIEVNQNEKITEKLAKNPLKPRVDLKQEPAESEKNISRVENFEIRKGTTNDMIIKGRFVQTNDYLVVSYTPPRKWSLQQQVKLLDEKCTQLLRSLRKANMEKNRLYQDIKKHEKLLPKIRHLQSRNRSLNAMLKIYKIKVKELEKWRKEMRRKALDDSN